MKGKTIFITGGNDGIGLATAQVFAQLGANVAIMGRRAESNQTAKVALESLGASCIAVTGDVAVEADIMRALEQTMAAFGRLDYAFNNAGIEQVPKPLPEQTEADYYKLFDVNVKGVWLCMKHEIPLMLRSGGGAIVNDLLGVGAARYKDDAAVQRRQACGARPDEIRGAGVRQTGDTGQCRVPRRRHDAWL